MIQSLMLLSGMMLNATQPKIGDQANYVGNVTRGNAIIAVSLTMKVTAYDAATNTYSVQTTQVVGGQTQTQTQSRKPEDVGSVEEGANIVNNCSAAQGVLEKIEVQNEYIPTCRLAQSSGNGDSTTINVAGVPFMIAKYVSTDTAQGTKTTLQLSSYVHGL